MNIREAEERARCVCGKPTVLRSKIDMRSCGRALCRAEIAEPKVVARYRRAVKALRYTVEVREVKCAHKHPPPDESCAKCRADAVFAEARESGLLEESDG